MQPQSQEAISDAGTLATADAVHATLRFLRVLRYRKSYVATSLAVTSLLGAVLLHVYSDLRSLGVPARHTNRGGRFQRDNHFRPARRTGSFRPTRSSSRVPLYSREPSRRLNKLPPAARIDLADVPREKWVTTLRDNLSARGARRTSVIEMTYHSKSPAAAEAVVQAIVDSYIDFVEKTHRDVSLELVELLTTERRETEKLLKEKQTELLAIKTQAGVVVREGADVVHPLVQRVIELNKTLVDVQKNRLQLDATLNAIQTAIRERRDLREHLTAVEPAVGQEMLMSALGLNPQFAEIAGQVERQLLADHAKLETLRRHYGPTHHEILQLEQTIRNSETYLSQYQANVSNRLNQTNQHQLGPMLQSFVEEKLATTAAHEQKLMAQYRQAEREAIALNDCMAELQMATNEEQRLRNLHDTLLDRIANIDLKQNRADVQVAIVSEPTASLRPVSPRRCSSPCSPSWPVSGLRLASCTSLTC